MLKGYHFMATRVDTPQDSAQKTQEQYFRVTDQVPEEVWYWAALGSIIVSASLFLMGKRDWSIFVGQWPPTFLLFGLFHKILRPSKQ
jgi:hypothetical protein